MTEDNDSTGSVLVPEETDFSKTKLDLKPLLLDLKRQRADAIQALVDLLKNNDPKLRLTAAKTLLELQVEVAKEINADQFQRLIAEVKLNGGGKKKDLVEDNRPLVDFATIRKVE